MHGYLQLHERLAVERLNTVVGLADRIGYRVELIDTRLMALLSEKKAARSEEGKNDLAGSGSPVVEDSR